MSQTRTACVHDWQGLVGGEQDHPSHWLASQTLYGDWTPCLLRSGVEDRIYPRHRQIVQRHPSPVR